LTLIIETTLYTLHHKKTSLPPLSRLQAKSTQHEKIIELLLMLPKRGPKAFATFLEAVRRHFPFLADKLETDLEKGGAGVIETT